jgi:hypothetical protein
MKKGRMEFKSADKAGVHVVRQEPMTVLYHTPAATSIHCGKFMLDKPRSAGPRPERPKKKK